MTMSSIELGIENISAQIRCLSCVATERVGAAFLVRVECEVFSDGEPISALSLDAIGEDVWVTFQVGGVLRRFEGIVDRLEDLEGHSVITLVAKVALLGDNRDYRVLPSTHALTCAREILALYGLELEVRAHDDAPPVRPQHLQSFESDLDFIARILAEEGLAWYPVTDNRAVVRVVDEPESFEDEGLVLSYREDAGMNVGRAISQARLLRRAASDRCTVRAYDFEKPELDVEGQSGAGALEWYEFDDEARSPAEAQAIAEIRLAERRSQTFVLEASSTAPELSAGAVVEIEGAPVAAQNGRFLVLSVEHRVAFRGGADDLAYEARFEAIPAKGAYRPARRRNHTRGGIGTSLVTGPSGQEISVDAYGRATLLLRWERRRASDEKASAPARILEPALSGSALHPRIGWEQVHAFLDSACESPLALGKLYNGADPPPLSLPAKKVETHLGTLSTPSGSSGHFLKISDAAGAEQFSLQSSGDYEERTENDKVSVVTGNLQKTVSGSRGVFVKENLVTGVDGASSLSVGGERKVTTNADYHVWAASESITAAGARIFSVGGDSSTRAPNLVRIVGGAKAEAPVEHQSVFTQGASTLTIGGSFQTAAGLSESVGVGGAAIVKVAGPMSVICHGFGIDVLGLYAESYSARHVHAGGSVAETFGALTHSIKGSAKIAGADIVIQAEARLVLKAGGATLTLTPGSIEIKGDFKGSVASVEGGTFRYG